MADFQTIVSTDTVNAALLTRAVNNFTAGQNSCASATAPASPIAYQFWADTTTGLFKQRNAANSAWITWGTMASTYLGLLSLSGGTLTGDISGGGTAKATSFADSTTSTGLATKGQIDARILIAPVYIGALSATASFTMAAGSSASFIISDVKILSDTATSGSSGGTNWGFNVYNVTQSLNLRSATKTTNGAEIAVNTVYALGLDQNLTIAASDVLRLDVTKTGSPTSLSAARIIAQINYKVTT